VDTAPALTWLGRAGGGGRAGREDCSSTRDATFPLGTPRRPLPLPRWHTACSAVRACLPTAGGAAPFLTTLPTFLTHPTFAYPLPATPLSGITTIMDDARKGARGDPPRVARRRLSHQYIGCKGDPRACGTATSQYLLNIARRRLTFLEWGSDARADGTRGLRGWAHGWRATGRARGAYIEPRLVSSS